MSGGEGKNVRHNKTSNTTSIIPPLSSPPEIDPLPEKVSLRSEEEEELKIYKILDETTLSPKEKKRICKQYTEPEVERAVNVAKHEKVKKTYMGLLLSILANPTDWADPSKKTQPRALECELDPSKAIELASEFNEKLKQIKDNVVQLKTYTSNKLLTIDLHKVAKANDNTIIEKYNMCIIYDGYLSTIPLNSPHFEQDIKRAIAQLR